MTDSTIPTGESESGSQFQNNQVYWECGPGWKKLIDPLIAACDRLRARVDQIKEKYGTLRFYYTPPDGGWCDELEDLVDAAEEESNRTCEMCGAPGTMRTKKFWLKTLCNEHAIDQGYPL
jgi:hypothetical protein